MQTFKEFVTKQSPINPLMPVCHTCDAYDFRRVIKEKQLSIRDCDVFKGEKLIYLFYGRAAYRAAKTSESTSLQVYFPTCFILKWHAMPDPIRILPFDSGAYHEGFLKEFFHPEMRKEHFFLEPVKNSPQKVVGGFFDSNGEYFKTNPKAGIAYDPMDYEIECYLNMINDKSAAKSDDRRASIEVQYNCDIALNEHVIDTVILPSSFLSDPEVYEVINNEWKVSPLTYETTRGNPNDYYGVVFQKLFDHYKKNSVI